MSGAAEVLDQIIDRYDKEGGSSGLRKNGESTVDQISSMISALHILDGSLMIHEYFDIAIIGDLPHLYPTMITA